MHQLQALRAIVSRITGSDPTSEKIRSILSRIESEASGLLELAKKPDPLKSPAANELVVNAEKARLRTLIAESRGKLTNLVNSFRAADEAARITRAKLVPDAFATEIRNVFRSLDTAGKHAFMGEAMKAGDGSTIAAIVTVPAVLSGLSAQQSEQYREAFLESIAPSNKGTADEMQVICDTAIQSAESLARPKVGA